VVLAHFGPIAPPVNTFCKLLKTQGFIYQKSLDTPVFRLIRFRQKVLTDLLPPLELFSLEEKAAQLPGGLFVSIQIADRLASSIFSDILWLTLQ
jgi:hypothetical protein